MARKNKHIKRVAIATLILANLAMAAVFVFHEALDLTSSNSALYVLRGLKGGIEVKRDLILADADRLVFMLDANRIFNYLMKGTAAAKKKSVLELTWDEGEGRGGIKEFMPGGGMVALSFSRFGSDIDAPHGLFLGGDLPYGDDSRSKDESSSGFGFFDGKDWHHIWCTTNEALSVKNTGETILPPHWKFMGSRVLKSTPEEAILESDHEVTSGGNRLLMKRFVSIKAGDAYYVLKVRLINKGAEPVSFLYSWGDEPWVGHYGSSEGDVGWYEGGIIEKETVILPTRLRYAGYWDWGNEAAGEAHIYTGHSNFVEWHTVPSYVFFSNDPNRCCEETLPLSSRENRVMGIVWDSQLQPNEERDYVLAIGMAQKDPSTGRPKPPEVRF